MNSSAAMEPLLHESVRSIDGKYASKSNYELLNTSYDVFITA